MTTLLVLYRAPEGGEDALATLESRYRDEHLPLVAQTPGLRSTRVWRVRRGAGRRDGPGPRGGAGLRRPPVDGRGPPLRPDARRGRDPPRDRAGPATFLVVEDAPDLLAGPSGLTVRADTVGLP